MKMQMVHKTLLYFDIFFFYNILYVSTLQGNLLFSSLGPVVINYVVFYGDMTVITSPLSWKTNGQSINHNVGKVARKHSLTRIQGWQYYRENAVV